MMELLEIAKEIENKIILLQDARSKLKQKGINKSNSISEYDKQLALTIMKLKNKNIIKFEDQDITDLPITLIEKIAKGICYQERLNLEIAESDYKSLNTYIEVVCAELNALQSIIKYFDKI